MMKVTKINYVDLKNKLNIEKYCVVYFSALWCGECKMESLVLNKVINSFSSIPFFEINVDDEKLWIDDENNDFKIVKVPTMILFKNGKEIERLEKFQPERKIKDFLNNNINSDEN